MDKSHEQGKNAVRMTPEEARAKYPNLWRVAQELARCKHPDKVADALFAMLAADPSLMEGGTQDG